MLSNECKKLNSELVQMDTRVVHESIQTNKLIKEMQDKHLKYEDDNNN